MRVVVGGVMAVGILAGVGGLGPNGAAQAAADPAEGRALAERWCAACHLVSPEQATAMDGVPSFREIAEREDLDPRALAYYLVLPHPPMPDMALSRREIDALVAYIETLGN